MSATEKTSAIINKDNILSEEGPGIGFRVKHFPQKNDTGVEVSITKLAASISGQIYAASSPAQFDLSTPELKSEVLLMDTHGDDRIVTPDFAIVITEKSMILGWQGSSEVMDFIIDFALTPVSSSRWSHISKDLQLHAGFQSIIENDLTNHEEEIVSTMEQHGITDLVTTGHSLGGALAQVAQFFIEAEMMKSGSIWKKYSDDTPNFKTKTVAFSAPMSIVNNATPDNKKVNEFLKKIDENSCNIIYSTDVVPRGFSHLEFIDDAIEAMIAETTDNIKNSGMFARFGASWFDLEKKMKEGYENKKGTHEDLFVVLRKYRHYGKIISYRNDTAVPGIYKDYDKEEPLEAGIGRFGDIKWEPTPDVRGKGTHDHNFTVRGPGLAYNIPKQKLAARLFYEHELSIMKGTNDVESVDVDGWDDCLRKAKKHLNAPSMGAVVVWERSDEKMHEGKGKMHVKKDIPKSCEDADKSTSSWFYGKENATTFWRTPALADLEGELYSNKKRRIE